MSIIDVALQVIIAGANAVSAIAQKHADKRAEKLDQPIGVLLIEQARADMERKRKERRDQKQ